MEDTNADYKNSFPAIDVSKDSVLRMLTKVAAFKMEERDLALDRFKRVNEEMTEEAEFWAHGKSAILYLDSASRSSNYLGDLARDVMKLVFKDEANNEGSSGASMTEDSRKRLEMMADAFIKERRKKNDKGNEYQPPKE